MSCSRIEDISHALTMALSNVDEEHLQGRQLLEQLNPTSAEFLTLASAPTPSPVCEIQVFPPAGDEEESQDHDYPEGEEGEDSAPAAGGNEEMDEEARAAQEMDEIEQMNRNGYWADDGYNDYDNGYGLDWNESGYFD